LLNRPNARQILRHADQAVGLRFRNMPTSPALIRIGTASWSIPKEHGAEFSIGGSHLERYAAVFNAVEINSSFYRPHRLATYECRSEAGAT
jgi:hypothetical protein